MWTCTKCGRTFKKNDQQHYCSEKPQTIAAYIEMQDEDKRDELRHMYSLLSRALPDAEERISWSMPTFWKEHNILHFAASKHHIGFYPGDEAVAHFANELAAYKTDKGTIRIPYGRIDDELIQTIARWCWHNGNHA